VSRLTSNFKRCLKRRQTLEKVTLAHSLKLKSFEYKNNKNKNNNSKNTNNNNNIIIIMKQMLQCLSLRYSCPCSHSHSPVPLCISLSVFLACLFTLINALATGQTEATCSIICLVSFSASGLLSLKSANLQHN